MTDIKDRLHQMMLRSGFQSRDDQQTLLAGVQEIEMLRSAIARIDAMNDNPSRYQADINAVCDTILRPHLVDWQ